MSIKKHPILGDAPEVEEVTVILDGVPIKVEKGQMIAAALLEKGVRVNRYTRKNHAARGIFCGIGQCTDCVMIVNGVPNVRTCVTPLEEGMQIQTQYGVEPKKED